MEESVPVYYYFSWSISLQPMGNRKTMERKILQDYGKMVWESGSKQVLKEPAVNNSPRLFLHGPHEMKERQVSQKNVPRKVAKAGMEDRAALTFFGGHSLKDCWEVMKPLNHGQHCCKHYYRVMIRKPRENPVEYNSAVSRKFVPVSEVTTIFTLT